MKYFALLMIVILAIVFVPFAIIWGLNVLFPVLAIPYTIETWAAIVIVSGVFKANVKVSK
jgi:hypothetical protein